MKALPSCLTASGLAAAAGAATPADRAFVAKVPRGGMHEVAASRLATARGSTRDMRDPAAAEGHVHARVGDRSRAISAGQGTAVASAPTPEFAARPDRPRGLSGTAFDRARLADMAALHDADGAVCRAFGAATHRIVRRHVGAIRGAPPPA